MADLNPFGTNNFGVSVKPLDYTHPHTPSMKVFHGLGIAVNGSLVGRIYQYAPSNAYNRKVTAVYEMSPYTFGQPVDVVPGGSEGEYAIDISRAEVWNQEFEIACGFGTVWENLSDQNRPFTLQEFMFRGKDLYQLWMYTGCWFAEKNTEQFAADGDGKVNITGKIVYVRRQRVA